MLLLYSYPSHSPVQLSDLTEKLNEVLKQNGHCFIEHLDAEFAFYFETAEKSQLSPDEIEKIRWFLGCSTFGQHRPSESSFLTSKQQENSRIIEFGPRLNFTTAFCTNALSALKAAGVNKVSRLERFFRFRIKSTLPLSLDSLETIFPLLHDRMTERLYTEQPGSFIVKKNVDKFFEIDVMNNGKSALHEANRKYGLALDASDINLYYDIFHNKAGRNPTNVELFDLAQSNSEHSRHWFFKGKLVVDNEPVNESLFQMVMDTQMHSNQNNVIKFCDNSSAIRGTTVNTLIPTDTTKSSKFSTRQMLKHITYTAETHNFPTGVCPFPGASTGTGGRIRDGHAAGRGSHIVAGVAGYSFGNLNFTDCHWPWESAEWIYPSNLAKPLEICIQASNGASDYGNKFGEPVICGFTRSFGLTVHSPRGPAHPERIEYVKPIMFSGGMGTVDSDLLRKIPPRRGMLVAKIGGPVYRIGVGGGSASSVNIQDEKARCEKLDFSAVQRGDAEMEQKLNRVVRACVEMGAEKNPIEAIHDQGAGGNGNVLKEIVEGAGAQIFADRFELGDPTLNALELWGAEYQESDAILVQPENAPILQKICDRERCSVNFVGEVSDDNRITLVDFNKKAEDLEAHPVDLNLDWVLGSVPRKTYTLNSARTIFPPLQLPADFSILKALEYVLNLPAVASKRYLTNKVDRSITGLVAQQQCVGCLHTPLADVAVTALSYFDTVGSAVAVGEQPIKMLVDPEGGARMSVAESLTNLVFAPITQLKDVKCSANWMWAAKMDGEGEKLYAACRSMCNVMSALGVAVDGGKDSLSMAALIKQQDGSSEIVKSPGTLVISAYAQCTNILKIVTPDLKCFENGRTSLYYVNFGSLPDMQKRRLGGSALSQCFKQLGNDSPDLDDPETFVKAFQTTQRLINDDVILSGHDISDGGLLVAVLEMAFAGNCGISVNFSTIHGDLTAALFNEETGIVIEILEGKENDVMQAYSTAGVYCEKLGYSTPDFGPAAIVEVLSEGKIILLDQMIKWRSQWEGLSHKLEKIQCNSICADSEFEVLKNFVKSPWKWDSNICDGIILSPPAANQPKIAILREEGSNGDREMTAAFYAAGFEPWDLCMQDLLTGSATLDPFDGLAFVGGFSYADVFGAAKGWASSTLYNESLKRQFDWFRDHPAKFSFGACNGCQLMALMGWVGSLPDETSSEKSEGHQNGVLLDLNESGRYESRFCSVKIERSNSVMLQGMEGSILGVWVAHGEGRFTFDSAERSDRLLHSNLVAMRFVDFHGQPTETYPLNPNGSPSGLAGICSPDGRHLALMPHPERSFLRWQWPHWPVGQVDQRESRPTTDPQFSPWARMFKNAFDWCLNIKSQEGYKNGS